VRVKLVIVEIVEDRVFVRVTFLDAVVTTDELIDAVAVTVL
jgi:hypothetical protein